MESRDALTPTRRYAGAWLDDLATIGAGWLDVRPVVRRLLLVLVIVLAGPALVVQSSYMLIALLILLGPRLPRARGLVVRWTGTAMALAGAVLIVVSERTWDVFPTENGAGLALLSLGLLFGARRGPWLLWLALGAVIGVLVDAPFMGGVVFTTTPIAGVLVLVLVARVSATPRPVVTVDVAAARERLAVALQGKPWMTSFVVCALATTMTGGLLGFSPPLGVALVALLFHATWRASHVFDAAAAWTAALAVPVVSAFVLYWLPWQATGATPGIWGGRSLWDFVLTPAMALPLITGLLLGRRRPGQRFGRADVIWLVVAVLCMPAATAVSIAFPSTTNGMPDVYRLAVEHPFVWSIVTVAWLPLFHRLVATDVPARRILWGALVAGLVQMVTIAVVAWEPDTVITLGRGALAPVAHWIAVALLLLLARDVARVTRIPDDHQLHTDFRADSRRP